MVRCMYLAAVAMLFVSLECAANGTKVRIPRDARGVKLYVMITPSHERYFNEWFRPTLQDEYELVVMRHEQTRADGVYMRAGWTEAVLKKVDMIIGAIKNNWGTVFVYSDVDIQFFQPTWPVLSRDIGKYDMLAQGHRKNKPVICTGFFACVGNERTLRTWQMVRQQMLDVMRKGSEIGDQTGVKLVMWRNPAKLKLGVLPASFMNGGGKLWMPGTSLLVPNGIVLHHANFVHSVDGKTQQEVKIAQLAHVREQVNASPELISASAVGEVRPLKTTRSSRNAPGHLFNRSHSLRSSMARSKLSSSAASRI